MKSKKLVLCILIAMVFSFGIGSTNVLANEIPATAKATKTTQTAKSTKTTVKKTVVKKYTNSELRLLSALIYSEAGNQSYKGKLAVGNVVLNRMKSSAYSHTKSVKGVIYDKKWGIQFSVIKKGSNGTSPINRALSLYDTRTSASGAAKENMLECIKAAKTALNGDNNIGSYLNFNRNSKYLSNKYSNHVIIGDHIFYNTK